MSLIKLSNKGERRLIFSHLFRFYLWKIICFCFTSPAPILLLCNNLHRAALLLTRKWQFRKRILTRLGVANFQIFWLILWRLASS